MPAALPNFAQLKANLKSAWMAGDFGQIATFASHGAREFVERIDLKPGVRVLDVACGTGNSAIPAARTGAKVTGLDIAPNLLEQARKQAAAENLPAQFDEGDAEELPYPEAAFDVVITMFGAMFAPRPERVAAELLRVCKPGGIVAMANWTPSGFVGKSFEVTAKLVPPPPGIPAPVLWGDEATVGQRFSVGVSKLTTTRRVLKLQYPFAPQEVVAFFRQYFGPTQTSFARLDPPGRQMLASRLEQLWAEHNQASDGTTMVEAEYLEVKAVRAHGRL
jgi:SAM-dependent methyltransferase